MSLTVRPTAYTARANASASMQILRHSQIVITMEIYSEVPSAKIRSALKRLGSKLDGERCTSVLCGNKIGRLDDRNRPLTWVELRGFEPLTPSMRTRCATGLRYSPKERLSA